MELSDDLDKAFRSGDLGGGSEDAKSQLEIEVENIVNHGVFVSAYYNTLVARGLPHQSALALTGELVRSGYAKGMNQ